MRVLITGAHGFIGFSLAVRLMQLGHTVCGVDKVKDAISNKDARREILASYGNQFTFNDLNLSNFDLCLAYIETIKPDMIVHLAGQYSVQHTTENAKNYISANCVGFFNILETARLQGVRRFIYASSTWVQDGKLPISMYASTKKFNEETAHVYSDQFHMETIGLRIASTYGPHIRPDVGLYQSAERLFKKFPIDMRHSAYHGGIGFVFIDDVVECIIRLLAVDQEQAYNVLTLVADDTRANLADMLQIMERLSGVEAIKQNFEGYKERAKDRPAADIFEKVRKACAGYHPHTKLDEGMHHFTEWAAPWFTQPTP